MIMAYICSYPARQLPMLLVYWELMRVWERDLGLLDCAVHSDRTKPERLANSLPS